MIQSQSDVDIPREGSSRSPSMIFICFMKTGFSSRNLSNTLKMNNFYKYILYKYDRNIRKKLLQQIYAYSYSFNSAGQKKKPTGLRFRASYCTRLWELHTEFVKNT